MKSLKNEYCMLTETHWKDVLNRYMTLKWFLKNEDLTLWCDKWLMIYKNLQETEIIKINSTKHDFYNVNMKIDSFFILVYTWDYNSLEFKILVTEFKKHYKMNLCSKQSFSFWTSFAALLQKQTQSLQNEKSTKQSNSHVNKAFKDCNWEDNECSNSCSQHSL